MEQKDELNKTEAEMQPVIQTAKKLRDEENDSLPQPVLPKIRKRHIRKVPIWWIPAACFIGLLAGMNISPGNIGVSHLSLPTDTLCMAEKGMNVIEENYPFDLIIKAQ